MYITHTIYNKNVKWFHRLLNSLKWKYIPTIFFKKTFYALVACLLFNYCNNNTKKKLYIVGGLSCVNVCISHVCKFTINIIFIRELQVSVFKIIM